MNDILLVFVSLGLLLSVVAFVKERRLRLALQQLLRRVLFLWKSHAQDDLPPDHDRRDADRDRV